MKESEAHPRIGSSADVDKRTLASGGGAIAALSLAGGLAAVPSKVDESRKAEQRLKKGDEL